MLGLFGHLAHAVGVFWTIVFCLFAAGYVAIVGPGFRGLLLPALPRRPGGRVRRSLRISSYLARGFSAAYFVAAWAVVLAAGYWAAIGAAAYKRAFSGRTLLDDLMNGAGVVVGTLVVLVVIAGYGSTAYDYYMSVRRWEQARVQRRRDLRAARTLAAIGNGAPAPHGPYSIWLRPFTSTGRCWVIARSRKAGKRYDMASMVGYRVVAADLETLLATVMEPIAPVIALGRSGEQVGAGRVDVPGDRWQEAFAVLARSAHAIFLLPSTRKGTHWEIDFLVREPALLARTVFLVPPAFFGGVHKIAGVERDPGTRGLGNRRELYKSMYGAQKAKGPYGLYDQMHAVNTIAIHDTLEKEATEVRAGALRTLEGILPPDDYAAVVRTAGGPLSASDGALLKLSNDGAVRVTVLARLRVGDSRWYQPSDGPRFDQSLFRAGLLDMVPAAGNPPPPG